MIMIGDCMKYEGIITKKGLYLGISICDVYQVENLDGRRIRLYHASYLPKADCIYYNRNLSLPYDFISYYDGLDVTPFPVEVEAISHLRNYNLMPIFELECRIGEVRDYAERVMRENSIGRKIYQYYKKNKG